MTHVLRYAARTDRGLLRATNQDSVYAGDRLLVIADGMGGHAAGDVASRLVVSAFVPLDELPLGTDMRTPLMRATREGNQAIAETVADSPELDGMGTTLTALMFDGPMVALAHVGDSRAYLYRNGVLHQISHDDTFVQSLVDEGRITSDEAAHHPQRSLLLRALNGSAMDPVVLEREISTGDRFLICSDGLSDYVSPESIADTLAQEDTDSAADTLIQLALVAGAPDNVTVVVADVLDTGVAGPAAVAHLRAEEDPDATGPLLPISHTQKMPRVPLPPIPEDEPARPEFVDGEDEDDWEDDDPDELDDEFGDDEYGDDEFDPDGPDSGPADPHGGRPGEPDGGADAVTAPIALVGRAGAGGPSGLPAARRAPRPGTTPVLTGPPIRAHRGRTVALIAALVVLLVAGLGGTWLWTRTKFYVGADSGQVVVYRGVSGSLLGLRFASVQEGSCAPGDPASCTLLKVDDLQQGARDQVRSGITVGGLDAARVVVRRLRDTSQLPICGTGSITSSSTTLSSTTLSSTTLSITTGVTTASAGSGGTTARTDSATGGAAASRPGTGAAGTGDITANRGTAGARTSGATAPGTVTRTVLTTVTRPAADGYTAPSTTATSDPAGPAAQALQAPPPAPAAGPAGRPAAAGTIAKAPPRTTARSTNRTAARSTAKTTARATPKPTPTAAKTTARTSANTTARTPTTVVTSIVTVTPTQQPSITLTGPPQVPGVTCRVVR